MRNDMALPIVLYIVAVIAGAALLWLLASPADAIGLLITAVVSPLFGMWLFR